MRACVFACGHSSRHQPPSLTWGERAAPLLGAGWSFLVDPQASPRPRGLCASGRPVGSSGAAGTGKAAGEPLRGAVSRPPAPPCGPPTRRSLFWSSPRRFQPARIPSALLGLTGAPPGAAPALAPRLGRGLRCHSPPPSPKPGPPWPGAVAVVHSALPEACRPSR